MVSILSNAPRMSPNEILRLIVFPLDEAKIENRTVGRKIIVSGSDIFA